MTEEQEEQIYKIIFFRWPENHRDFETLKVRLYEMVYNESKLHLLEAEKLK